MWFFFSFLGGANNPFLQEDTTQQYSYTADGKRIEGNQDQYYGAGYSQAQSGYSSSGFGELQRNFLPLSSQILRSRRQLWNYIFQVFNKTSQTFNGVDEHFCCQAYYETYQKKRSDQNGPQIGKRRKWSWGLTTPNSVHSIRCGLPTYSKFLIIIIIDLKERKAFSQMNERISSQLVET